MKLNERLDEWSKLAVRLVSGAAIPSTPSHGEVSLTPYVTDGSVHHVDGYDQDFAT